MLKIKDEVKSIAAHVASNSMARRMSSKYCNGFATVFVVHRAHDTNGFIHGHDPGLLERILINLKKQGFNLLSLQDVALAAQGLKDLPVHSVAFTMDDGYRDQIESLVPIFIKHEIPLTVFLTTGLVNGELWTWDAKIHWLINKTKLTALDFSIGKSHFKWPLSTENQKIICRRELQGYYTSLTLKKAEPFLQSLATKLGLNIPEKPPKEFAPASWDQVQNLENSGVRFAPHTHTHNILSRLSEEEVRYELVRSLELIRKKTRFGLPVLAYPVGESSHFSFREIEIAREVGFNCAFAVCNKYSRWLEAKKFYGLRYNLCRFGMPDSIAESLWLASGIKNLTGKLKAKPFFAARGLNLVSNGRKKNDKFIKINAQQIKRLVFVCRGNVSRSPYAEAWAKKSGFPAVSCGIDVKYSAPAEIMGICAGLLRGKDMTKHMSRSIFDIEIKENDCLVVMDKSHLPVSKRISAKTGCQLTLLGLWKQPVKHNIEDPYGGDLETFQNCYTKIDEAMNKLIYFIKKHNNKSSSI